MKAIIGRKMGMTEVFAEDGTMYAVTVVEVLPNIVTQVKTLEKVYFNIDFYKVKNMSLTSNEIAALKIANTISYYDLFGKNVDNINITVQSGENFVTCGVNSLQVTGVGEVVLMLNSKYDLTISGRVIHILTVCYSGEFSVSYNGNKLNKFSNIELKKGTTKYLESSITTSVVLYNRAITLESPKYRVEFEYGKTDIDNTDDVVESSILGNEIGIHTMSCNFEGYNIGDSHYDVLPLNIYLSLVDYYGSAYEQLLKNYTLTYLEISKLLSVNSINISKSKAEISLVDELVVSTYLNSDKENEEIKNIEVYDNNGNLIERYTNFEEDVESKLNMFIISVDKVKSEQVGYQFRDEYKVVIKANIKNKKYFEYGVYKFKFNTYEEDVNATIEVKLISQEILSVQINNYTEVNTTKNGVIFNYETSSVISPNSSSLLDIMVYPSYSNYSYLTVTSNVVNGNALSLVSYRLNEYSAYTTDSTRNFEFIENGVKIYQREEIGDSVSRYYVRAIASSDVKINSMYTITVNVYDENGIMYTERYNLNVCPQEKAGLYDENGNDYAVALSGSDITIYMVKEIEQEYSFYTISDRDFASVVFNNDWQEYGPLHERASFTIHINSQKEVGLKKLQLCWHA